ncbi:hypothetical protein P5673_009423 [Acropora cervicornis]|uniref:Uncharacterized protein n=1 Tax=Acropora cervicornis TaxID=6130 RepID=A0AAD9VA16_ACRCE|nr:hypothetical protein P5673_009423 [Acropora cervicornis]
MGSFNTNAVPTNVQEIQDCIAFNCRPNGHGTFITDVIVGQVQVDRSQKLGILRILFSTFAVSSPETPENEPVHRHQHQGCQITFAVVFCSEEH